MLNRKQQVRALKLLDVVRLRTGVVEPSCPPWGGSVAEGALGTIVDQLESGSFIVEFGGAAGEPVQLLTLPASVLVREWSARQ